MNNASSYFRSDLKDIELREQMLEDRWNDSLWRELERQLGKTRMSINGIADSSQNPLADYARARSVVYSPAPLATGLDPRMAAAIGDSSGFALRLDYASLLEDARRMLPSSIAALGIEGDGAPMPSRLAWLLGHAMRYWLTCNEVGIFCTHADGQLILKRARASSLRGQGDPESPGVPLLLGWNRPVRIGSDVMSDTWDVWDIRDPSAPSYRIIRGPTWEDDGEVTGGADITRDVTDEEAKLGESYPWRWTKGDREGQARIPMQMYHANYPEALFDRTTGSALTQGTLTTGVLGSFWLHVCRDVSWPDRNVRGMSLVGTVVAEDGEPRSVPNDPAAIKQWDDENAERPGEYWQWAPGADPKLLMDMNRSYRQLLDEQAIPVDISSVGGDPLKYRVEAMRRVVEGYYPICRQYDSGLLEMIAATLNGFTGTDYEESGYGLLYRTEIDDLRAMLEKRATIPTITTKDAPNV